MGTFSSRPSSVARPTPWHPHRGFETVTYIIDGAFEHRDSTGGGGLITDGATQWMTAGAGILHDEMPPEELITKGGLFHGTQLWVNLPKALGFTPPRYQSIESDNVVLLASDDGGAPVRVIAGDIAGHPGPGLRGRPLLTPTRRSVPALSCSCPGGRTSTPWSTY